MRRTKLCGGTPSFLQGGKYFKSGHISVEFGPSFEDQVMTKVGNMHT
jgi:hypothetical protein